MLCIHFHNQLLCHWPRFSSWVQCLDHRDNISLQVLMECAKGLDSPMTVSAVMETGMKGKTAG